MKKPSIFSLSWVFTILWGLTMVIPVIDSGPKLGRLPIFWAYGGLVISVFDRSFDDAWKLCLLVIFGHVGATALIAWVIIKVRQKVQQSS